ncbi:hypothetical protein Q9L58_002194 [Maublancomyces gigas]|uniref:Phosphatidic acid phosphatase type 2/haloperoxidase domain-containing protein n=1 Tax=Discina gigas TaxID=1032678 RepID=A0ABR3GS57_9PEZI
MPGSATAKARYHDGSGGAVGTFRRLWQKSYVPDWIGLFMIVLENLAIVFLEPFKRMFSLDDLSIQFPHAEIERVPVPLLLVYTVAFPAIFITIYTLLIAPKKSGTARLHQLHVGLLGLAISLMLTTFITDLIKNGVGRPRPDLIARCKPKEGTPKHELVGWEVCTETDHHTLHDGFRSFPSGHSSFSWSGLGYLSLFLFGQLRALRPGSDLTKFVIAALPALGALLITISRTEDYRHDVYDVSTGSLIGMVRRYFPPLTVQACDEPFASRDQEIKPDNSRGDFEMLPTRVDSPDLEAGERRV